jgi:hypothetical protein
MGIGSLPTSAWICSSAREHACSAETGPGAAPEPDAPADGLLDVLGGGLPATQKEPPRLAQPRLRRPCRSQGWALCSVNGESEAHLLLGLVTLAHKNTAQAGAPRSGRLRAAPALGGLRDLADAASGPGAYRHGSETACSPPGTAASHGACLLASCRARRGAFGHSRQLCRSRSRAGRCGAFRSIEPPRSRRHRRPRPAARTRRRPGAATGLSGRRRQPRSPR